MLHIYFTPYFTYEVFSEVTIFYVNNPETIQRIKYIKQQYKIYPTVLFFLRQTVFSLHFSDFFFFLSGFSFTTIHESQDYKGRGRAFL